MGESHQPCRQSLAHPLYSRRIAVECDVCTTKRQRTDYAIAEFKLRLHALRLNLEVGQARKKRRYASSLSASESSSGDATSESGDEEHNDSFVEGEEELVRSTETTATVVGDKKVDSGGPEPEEDPEGDATRDGSTDADMVIAPNTDLTDPEGFSGESIPAIPIVLLEEDGSIPAHVLHCHISRNIDAEAF